MKAAAIEHALSLIFPTAGPNGWVPQPKQKVASELAGQVDDLLYGGAAGGGKTEWLIEYVASEMEANAFNRGVIFRRVFPSLDRSVVPRAKAKLWGRAKWNGQNHTFTFPNGSVLELASLQYADTVYDHQGAEYGIVAFEEITEFLQGQVEYMIGRLRSPADGIRPHLVATTNPGGRGHKWVKRWWVKPKVDDIPFEQLDDGREIPVKVEPYKPWRPAATPDNPKPRLRAFVPATLADNPKLLERDPDYVNRLRANSNRALRKALEEGDWDAIDAVEGALWDGADLDRGRVRLAPTSARRVVAVDPSDGDEGGDGFGVSVCSRGRDGVLYVEASYEWRMSPRKMAEATIQLSEVVGADAIVVEKNHGGKWMLEVFRQVDPYANLVVTWASDGKRTRAEPVAALFEHDPKARLPYRARIVGFQEDLENELTETNFREGEPSPNRLDALVWAGTELMLGQRQARNEGQMDDQRLAGRR